MEALREGIGRVKENRSFRMRLLMGLIFIPLLVFVAVEGRFYFLGFVDLILLFSMLEFYRMMRKAGYQAYRAIGVGTTLVLTWYVYFRSELYSDFLLTAALMLIATLELFRQGERFSVKHMAVTIFGVLYVGWLGGHFVALRELPLRTGTDYGDGARYAVLPFFLAWISDTAAYLGGRFFGKTKLFPRVSPGKSVEGALFALFTAPLAAWLAKATFAHFLSALDVVALGLIVCVASQLGDLVESMIKREAEVKDSSNMIPGHGGLLDRFDSVLFAAPAVYYYLVIAVL
ncbi:MAG: phosphatidate cytidylyltransferase [Candidatus Eisenbacteria bacterium]|nr:phosphatidate cytidylyltransferase [Candidatus Eisenbacteria bacterium]